MTINRNTGISWVMLSSAGVVGNTISYFVFGESRDITTYQRNMLVSVLLALSSAGVLVQLTTLPMPWAKDIEGNDPDSIVTSLKKAAALFITPKMLLLVVVFLYTGLQSSMGIGVYGPSLGFTMSFKHPLQLTGLHGILFFAGGVVAGLSYAQCTHLISRFGRWPIIVLATVMMYWSLTFIILNIPNDAPLGETTDEAFLIPSNAALALVTSVLLGFVDGCLNVLIMSLLSSIYPEKSGQAFAIFKSVQHLANSVAFFYAGYLNLYWQVSLLAVFALAATIIFVTLDVHTMRQKKENIEVKHSATLPKDG